MFNSLPKFAAEMRETKEQLNTINIETKTLIDECKNIANQFSIKKATGALYRYENDLGLQNAGALTYPQRRERVLARVLSSGTCTPAALKDIIERVGGVEVNVKEHFDIGQVEVVFVGQYGVPRFLEDIKRAVRLVLPAHIGVIYTFKYKTLWDYYENTLSDIYTSTFNDLY